jgi:hypothetical protein
LKPERWGSPLVQEMYQEEKACDKRHDNDNNNNNNNNNNEQQIRNQTQTIPTKQNTN